MGITRMNNSRARTPRRIYKNTKLFPFCGFGDDLFHRSGHDTVGALGVFFRLFFGFFFVIFKDTQLFASVSPVLILRDGRKLFERADRETSQKVIGRTVQQRSAGQLQSAAFFDQTFGCQRTDDAGTVDASDLFDKALGDRLVLRDDRQHLHRRL